MGNSDIREPIQKRSIEKKEKIIQAGFELICSHGYYNTNTAEIAKAAGVSTGIVYQYFKDKHDILIDGIKLYANSIFYPMTSIMNINITQDNLETVLRKMIKEFIQNHKLSQAAHEEIMAMVHSDKQIAEIYHRAEIDITDNLTSLLATAGFSTNTLKERVHISINLIDDLCHEIVYHKHSDMNYNNMIDIVLHTIIDLLK